MLTEHIKEVKEVKVVKQKKRLLQKLLASRQLQYEFKLVLYVFQLNIRKDFICRPYSASRSCLSITTKNVRIWSNLELQ